MTPIASSPSDIPDTVASRMPSIVRPPSFDLTRDGITPYTPTIAEVLVDFWDSVNIALGSTRYLAAIQCFAHVLMLVPLIVFFGWHLNWISFGLMWTFGFVFITVYNTFWYH